MAEIKKRVKKNGKISYTASIRIKGYPILSATFEKLTDLREWVQDNESKMKKGKHIQTVKARKMTLTDVIDRYLENELTRRNSDHQKFKMQLGYWKQHLGAYFLSSLTPDLIGKYRDELQKEPFKYKKLENGEKIPVYRTDGTVNRYLASLSIAYSFAVKEWGWADDNIVLKVRKRSESKGRIRFLKALEQKTLLDECTKVDEPYLYVVVVLALATGARFSEIMGLKWSNLDFNKNTVTYFDTKNGDNKTVPLSAYPKEILLKHSKVRRIDTDFVFPRKDGLAPKDIRKKWEKALENSGIENFKFHDLRHTAASNLAMNGATALEIATVLGHRTLQMVKRYSHLSTQYTATILDKMNEKQFADIRIM